MTLSLIIAIKALEVGIIEVSLLFLLIRTRISKAVIRPELEVITTRIGDGEIPAVKLIFTRERTVGEGTDIEDGIGALILRGVALAVHRNGLIKAPATFVDLNEIDLLGHLLVLVDLKDKVKLRGLLDADGPIEPAAVGLDDESALQALKVGVCLLLYLKVDRLWLDLITFSGFPSGHSADLLIEYRLDPLLILRLGEGIVDKFPWLIQWIGGVLLRDYELPTLRAIGLKGNRQRTTVLTHLELIL